MTCRYELKINEDKSIYNNLICNAVSKLIQGENAFQPHIFNYLHKIYCHAEIRQYFMKQRNKKKNTIYVQISTHVPRRKTNVENCINIKVLQHTPDWCRLHSELCKDSFIPTLQHCNYHNLIAESAPNGDTKYNFRIKVSFII